MRHALGLKASGGRPRKIGRVRSMAEEVAERLEIMVAEGEARAALVKVARGRDDGAVAT
jgi:hypothetical protein